MELVPASLGGAPSEDLPRKSAAAAHGHSEHSALLVGQKRPFGEIERDRTFAAYLHAQEELCPCPYQVGLLPLPGAVPNIGALLRLRLWLRLRLKPRQQPRPLFRGRQRSGY